MTASAPEHEYSIAGVVGPDFVGLAARHRAISALSGRLPPRRTPHMKAVLVPEERTMERAGRDEFSSWVHPHLPAMRRLAVRLTDASCADDVVQEALLRAWQRRTTYDEGRGAPVGWLLAIVVDRARRHRTRSRTHARLDEASEAADHSAAADGRDLDLERAVERLSGRQRLAVELYYFVGADVATCAAAMDCAEGTVRATLHQARARLRDLIGDES